MLKLLSQILSQIWITIRKWVIIALLITITFLAYKYYYTKSTTIHIIHIIPKYIKTTIIKNIPILRYKTIKVNHIEYIPEKEYLKVTKLEKIPEVLKHSKIIAVAKTPAYAGKTLVSCILKKNGSGEILIKELPYQKILISKKKFFSIKPKFSLGMGYGFIRELPTITETATYRFLRAGNFKIEAKDIYFNANSNNYIGLEIKYGF